MKHIAIDLRCLLSPYPTGVATYTRELLTAIFKIDSTNHYYLFTNSSRPLPTDYFPWRANNIRYIHTRWPNKLLNVLLALGLIKLDRLIIKKIKTNTSPPTTHSTLPALDAFYSPNFNFTSLSPNIRHVLTVHDLSFEFFPHFFSYKQRLWHRTLQPKQQAKRATHICVPSENTKRDLVKQYHTQPEKISVLYPGLSNNFIASTASSKKSASESTSKLNQMRGKHNLPEPYFLFVGALEPRKNILNLITAFELFSQHQSLPNPYSRPPNSYHLVLAGPPGYGYQTLLRRIKKSAYKKNIKILGYVDEADKPLLYQAASAFVYPSLYEGFGFPVLEALSQSVPVITSNRSSLPEITGSAAWLVNPNMPTEIAVGLRTIVTSEETKNRLSKGGLDRSTCFSYEEMVKNFLHTLFTITTDKLRT